MTAIREILKERAAQVKELEAAARVFLYEQGDKARYHELLREKTMLLFQLQEEIEQMECDLGTSLRKEVKDRIGGISFSAGKALDLDSVFYMAALLYPENYQEGDRNDLEQLIVYMESVA